jgi:hypothetical protein
MARSVRLPEDELGVSQLRKGGHMTADLMKRKFRNFPSAELLRRIAAARLAY